MKNEQIIVGAVKVNKTWKHHNASFECAAWWEDTETCQGVFPLYLMKHHLSPHHLQLISSITCKVTDDYFPSLWCGNAISSKPYQPKHIGEERILRHPIDIDQAIARTGNIPGNDLDIYFHPDWWSAVEAEATHQLFEYKQYLDQVWENYRNLDPATFTVEPNQFRHSFHSEFEDRLSSVAFAGKTLSKWANRLKELSRYSGYRGKNGKDPIIPDRLYRSNIEWSNVIVIPPFDATIFPLP